MGNKSEIEILKSLVSTLGEDCANVIIDYVNMAVERSAKNLRDEIESNKKELERKCEPRKIYYGGSTPKVRY